MTQQATETVVACFLALFCGIILLLLTYNLMQEHEDTVLYSTNAIASLCDCHTPEGVSYSDHGLLVL